MDDPFDLERFVTAQAPVRPTIEAELAAGRKRSHWMWFVFPQLRALGRSERAIFYGLSGLEEAEAYLAHPVLGAWLISCTQLVIAAYPAPARRILGKTDALKFRSCMTLFAQSKNARGEFQRALDLFYGGPDPETMRLLAV